MTKPDYIPQDYKRIKVVDSLTELFNAPFGEANCILYPRSLTGDFNNLARQIAKMGMQKFLGDHETMPFILSKAERQVKADMAALKKFFDQSDLLKPYMQLRVQSSSYWNPQVSPDAFHIDGARNSRFGRVLCNYNTPLTEWIRNEDAVLTEYANFTAREGAPIYTFAAGDLWRIKCQTKDKSGFIHRKPEAVQDSTPKDPPRLLLVAG